MKSLEDLKKLRDAAQSNMSMRTDEQQKYRVVVGMATCGIAAGACSGCNRSESEILRTGYGHCGDSGRRGAASGIYPCSLCRWFQSMESVV